MPSRPKSKRTASLPVVTKHDKQVATRPVMLLVLGPHRSGTSLTARMLDCLGAENSQNQLLPQPDNPTGFFEDSDVYAFGESVFLPKIQRRWDSVSPTDWSVLSKTDRSRLGLQALEIIRRNYALSNPLSVLKEPRINNTLPFWLSLLEHAGFDARFVCVVRDPVSTARSLGKRNNFSLAHGGMMYLSAWLSVLPHLQERQVSFVQFDEIFATPGKVLGKMAEKLGLPLPADFDQRLHEFTSTHLEPALRHSSLPREDVMLEPDLPPLATELYRVLLDAAQSQNVRKTAKFIAYAERQVESLAPLLADYDAKQTRLASLQTESDVAKAECARLQSQLTDSSHQSYAAITAERDAVVAERETLRSRISALEAEHSELASRHQPLATVLEGLKGQHTSLLTERDTLAQERELIRSERDTLAQERDNLIAERDALATRHQQLATALEDLQGQHSSLSTIHSSLTAERDALTTRISTLEAEHSELASHHASLATERDALQSNHSSLVAERDDLATRHASIVTVFEELQGKHSSLVAERDTSVQERDQIRSERETLAQEHTQLIAERDELAARVTSFEAQLSSLSTLHSSLVAEHDDLATRQSSLLTESKALQSAHSSLSTLHSSLIAERDALSVLHSSLVAELDSVRRELITQQTVQNETQTKLASTEQDLSDARSAREKTEAGAKDTAEENELLLNQLHQVQEELEKYFLANRELKQQHDHLTASHATLVAERDDLATRHSSLATALEELQSQHSSLVAERDEFATRQASLIKERDELHSKAKDLDVSLQTRFSELAIAARALKEKEDRLRAIEPITGQSGVSLLTLEILDSQEQSPHRHLNIRLEGLQWESTRSPQDLRFRLVEHHGRPGVALFDTASSSGSGAWTSWQETGKEAGQSYILLVPGDQHGARALGEANGLDFYLLQFLLTAARDQLERDIRDDNPTLNSKRRGPLAKSRLHAWHATALALQAQLATHANLLRFDPIRTVRWEHDVDSRGQSTVQLENVAFAGLFHRHEQLQLTITDSHSRLYFSDSPMFSSVLPGCSPKIELAHRFKLGQSRHLDFPHKPSPTGTAYLASLGRALPRIFLDGEHATFDDRVEAKEVRRGVLALSKQLQSLQA